MRQKHPIGTVPRLVDCDLRSEFDLQEALNTPLMRCVDDNPLQQGGGVSRPPRVTIAFDENAWSDSAHKLETGEILQANLYPKLSLFGQPVSGYLECSIIGPSDDRSDWNIFLILGPLPALRIFNELGDTPSPRSLDVSCRGDVIQIKTKLSTSSGEQLEGRFREVVDCGSLLLSVGAQTDYPLSIGKPEPSRPKPPSFF